MRRVMAMALALLTFPLLASRHGVAAAAEASAQLGDLTVKLVSNPDPPRTGDNRLTVALQDASGR